MICIFFALTFTDKFPPKQKINQLVNVNVKKKKSSRKKNNLAGIPSSDDSLYY